MYDTRYLTSFRKYLDLSEIYYNEYNPKADAEVIFENNFKYEISLSACGLFLTLLTGLSCNQYCALFSRKIIEDYYLYKLRYTKYLTRTNFELFKISSLNKDVGSRFLSEISEDTRLPINLIKKRMLDTDFWIYPIQLNSFEKLFELDYEGVIDEKTNKILKKLYRSLGMYLHQSNSLSLTEMNIMMSYLSIITKIAREVIGNDYKLVKKSSNDNFKHDFLSSYKLDQILEFREAKESIANFCKEFKNIDLAYAFYGLISNIRTFLLTYRLFYDNHLQSMGLLLNKLFIEQLCGYYALIKLDQSISADSAHIVSNFLVEKLVISILNDVSIEDILKNNKDFKVFYYKYNNSSYEGIEEFVNKYKNNPSEILNNKFSTFTALVDDFLKMFEGKNKIKNIYIEACEIGHSYGLIQKHLFNYKKSYMTILNVIDIFFPYFAFNVCERNYNKKNEEDAKQELYKNVKSVCEKIQKIIRDEEERLKEN